MRLELLTERKSGLHAVGLSTYVPNDFLELTDVDTSPRLTNHSQITFPPAHKKKIVVTHVAFLPPIGWTGVITRLINTITLRKKGDLFHFPAGSLSWDMKLGVGQFGTVIQDDDMFDELIENMDEAHKDLMIATDRYSREASEVIDYLRKN